MTAAVAPPPQRTGGRAVGSASLRGRASATGVTAPVEKNDRNNSVVEHFQVHVRVVVRVKQS